MRQSQRRALWLALVANGLFVGVEIAGAIAFSSLALLADAAHMGSDVVALSIALIAQSLMDRPASARHSYGLKRVEVLGALANAVVLFAVSAWIVIEATDRLGDPVEVDGGGLIVVATLGLVINLASAVVLARRTHGSLNMHGAFLHMAADAAGSVGVIAAGIAVLAWGATWVDPVASIAIAGLVVWSAWHLLRATISVLLEATPRGMDPAAVEAAIVADPSVTEVHHLHLWNIASDMPALSAHVVLDGEMTLHDAQRHGDRLKKMLADRFGIEHSTLELECHSCEPQDHGRVVVHHP